MGAVAAGCEDGAARSAALQYFMLHEERQAIFTAQRARRQTRPPSLAELCLMLNNLCWARRKLGEVASRLVRKLPALRADPRAGLPRSAEACDAAALELAAFLCRRTVYRALLPHLSHARAGALAPLLERLNQAANTVATIATAPWRLPALQGTLGTFALALDHRLSSPARFDALVAARRMRLVPRGELGLLRESFADEGCALDEEAEAALQADEDGAEGEMLRRAVEGK